MMRALSSLVLVLLVAGSAGAQARSAVLVLTFPDSDPPLNDVVGGTQTETQWVETYYAEQSYGRFTWQGDAFGVLTIPRPVNPTSAVDARTQVATAAREAAIDLTGIIP